MADIRSIFIDREGNQTLNLLTPPELSNLVIVIERDMQKHGIFFDYGIDRLTWVGADADMLELEYGQYGVNGIMSVKIEIMCAEGTTWDELYTGRINFVDYKRTCGLECTSSATLEDEEDILLYRNNYDQKVNLIDNIAFDKTTVLTNYEGLNFEKLLPSRELRQRMQATANPGQHQPFPINYTISGLFVTTSVRPSFTLNVIDEIPNSDLPGTSLYRVNPQNDPPTQPTVLSPILKVANITSCTNGVFFYTIRLKGHFAETGSDDRNVAVQLVFFKGADYNDINDPAIAKQTIVPPTDYATSDGPDLDFDVTFMGSVPLNVDDEIRVMIYSSVLFNGSFHTTNTYVTWDAETSVNIYTNTQCAPTTGKIFMINEAISRTVEAITNDKIRFYSESFGRVDSQPYALGANGCAGMMSLTNGLNIRNKTQPNGTQSGVFASMRDWFEEMSSIWNIGETIEDDPNRPGFKRLRFEDWKYFYQNQVVMAFQNANIIETEVDESRIFNIFQGGYEKWEAQQLTGLDEFMTKRTYRTNINSISQTLDKVCNFIASTYCIEETRRLRDTTQDWTYDNDIFLFCMRPSDSPIPSQPDFDFEYFATSASFVSNVLNPSSCYNGRIDPVRNAMRWFSFMMQPIKVLGINDKMYFSEGNGNYVARYRLNNCEVAGSTVIQNMDIGINNFSDPDTPNPPIFAEIATFNHPFSYSQFKKYKDDPSLRFKAVSYYCGIEKKEGYIKRIAYNIGTGTADIEIIPKNARQINIPIEPCDATVSNIITVFCGDNCVEISWDTEGSGNNWHWTLTNVDNPLANQSGISNEPNIIFSELVAGFYVFEVVGYCDEAPGTNVISSEFNIENPLMIIQLSATKVFRPGLNEWKWSILIEPVNYPSFQQNFSFNIQRCAQDNIQSYCNLPGQYASTAGFIGGTSLTPDTYGGDSETSELYLIVIQSLSGLLPEQIIKRPDQDWDLIIE